MVDLAYVIAGSEATGGAGLQADLKTFQQMGVYGIGTVTCIVSFDPAAGWGHRFYPVPPDVIGQQIEAATATHDLDVVKVGMLGTPATIEQVARGLRSQPWRHVVVDPVLICKGQEPGVALDTDQALRDAILPLATVVTPNNFEARTLAGMDTLADVEDLIEAGRRIVAQGPRAAVVKGGVQFPGDAAVDVLVEVDGDGIVSHRVYSVPKVGTEGVSGAGCTFAAAITASLAKGAPIADAVATAKRHVTQGIVARVAAHTPFTTVWQGAFAG
jgi:pyridoxine kinase